MSDDDITPVLPRKRVQWSGIATQVPGMLDPDTCRRREPWGLCLHTTGRGIVDKAARTGRKPLDVALDEYRRMQDGSSLGYRWGGPHYVIDHDGGIYQIAPDFAFTAHCGGPHRADYLDGSWVGKCSDAAVHHWRAQWGARYSSPQSLFPSRSANEDYIGVEMIPCGSGFGVPRREGELFTIAQYDAAVALAKDIARRQGWPADWAHGPRLVGHEDVQLIDRHDGAGGWDPGYLRARPYFDMGAVREALR